MSTATFTTPAQLPQCDGLSIVEATVESVKVKNNTGQAIHGVRAFTYYNSGYVSPGRDLVNESQMVHELSELQPGAIGEITHPTGPAFGPTVKASGVVQLVNPATTAVLCETPIEPLWWHRRTDPIAIRPAKPSYWVSTQLDNPLAGAGETATVTVTAYAKNTVQLLQACVNLNFDGVAPVDSDGDGHHDVVIYDGPNGKYKEDGTLNQDSQGNDLGYRRAGRLEYDSDGYDEDVESNSYRPQCSDAAGKFEGGLFRIGNTERRTNAPPPGDVSRRC